MRAVTIAAFLLTLTVAATASPLAAQRRELTLLAGGNFSGATGPRVAKSESRVGFQGGLSLRMPRTSMVSFQIELLLVRNRFYAERAASTQPPLVVGPRSDAPSILYAKVPILLRLERGYSTERPIRPFLLIGPYVGARLACRRELIEAGGVVSHPGCNLAVAEDRVSSDTYLPAAYQEFDIGVQGALGLEIRRFALGVRAEKSIRNMVDVGAFPTSPLERARLWSVSLSAEYLLRVL
jgi:hypothetical protein